MQQDDFVGAQAIQYNPIRMVGNITILIFGLRIADLIYLEMVWSFN